ncbi:hypothetical protein [Dactylosporangium sp. NPDC000521]
MQHRPLGRTGVRDGRAVDRLEKVTDEQHDPRPAGPRGSGRIAGA